MEKLLKSTSVKRTQKDYNLSLKFQIVKVIENRMQSTFSAFRKYSIQAKSILNKTGQLRLVKPIFMQ
jgi:hypothetical protein